MIHLNEFTLTATALLLTAAVVRSGLATHRALADVDASPLRAWLGPATKALLAMPLLAAVALGVYVATADAPRLRLSHGALVLGLWSASGILAVSSMALRAAGRGRLWVQLSAGLVGAAAAMLTPIGGFTRILTVDAIALAPAAGVLLAIAAVLSTNALRAVLGAGVPLDPSMRARRASKHALAAIAVMLTYLLVTNHVPMAPWNDLSAGSQALSSLAAVAPFGLVALAIRSRNTLAIGVGALWTAVWFAMQLVQWWVPYLFGPTFLHRSFDWYAEGGYASTLTILPAIGERPVPDLQHLVLQALSIVVIVATVRTAAAARGVRSST